MSDDWTTPGAFEVAEGVHRIPLPLPDIGLKAVNVYVVETSEGPVLVDSGWDVAETGEILTEGLAALGHTPADIRCFLITHAHRDHYAHAIHVRRAFGTPVGLGSGERPSMDVVRDPDSLPMAGQFNRLRCLGASALADEMTARLGRERVNREDWELPDNWLDEGDLVMDERRTLAVVPTPGHTRGHVVFHDESAMLLFAGDHVLPTITPSIGFEPALSPNPLGDFLASLAVVRARPDARLLPAHGPVTDSAHARVDELVAHHDVRLTDTERAVVGGATTGLHVAEMLTWTRRQKALSDLDPYNQMLAISETGAHLNLLVAQGRVTVTVESGVERFLPA